MNLKKEWFCPDLSTVNEEFIFGGGTGIEDLPPDPIEEELSAPPQTPEVASPVAKPAESDSHPAPPPSPPPAPAPEKSKEETEMELYEGLARSILPRAGITEYEVMVVPCAKFKEAIGRVLKNLPALTFTSTYVVIVVTKNATSHKGKLQSILKKEVICMENQVLCYPEGNYIPTPAPVEDFYIDYGTLDDHQRKIIDMKNEQSMVVEGSAGTGKSLIALHKARQIAASGESYAVVIYTKSLCRYIAMGSASLGLKNVYYHYQWKNNVYKQKVKYLIVDECQDFSQEEIEEFRQFGEHFLFFGDTAQSIMAINKETLSTEQIASLFKAERFPLYTNYRLTQPIAKLAEQVGKVQNLESNCVRNGEKPTLIETPTLFGQLDEIIKIVQNKNLRSVGILVEDNEMVRSVRDYLTHRGLSCEHKDKLEENLNFHSHLPKVLTYWSAKGLQFKDVFIPACETQFFKDKRSALYVAITRASEWLYLLYSGALHSFFPAPSSPLYQKPETVEMI